MQVCCVHVPMPIQTVHRILIRDRTWRPALGDRAPPSCRFLPLQTPGRGRHLRRDAPGRTATSFRPVCRRGLRAIRTITAPGPGRLSTARSELLVVVSCNEENEIAWQVVGLRRSNLSRRVHGIRRCSKATYAKTFERGNKEFQSNIRKVVYTENLIRVDDVMESPKLTE